MNVVIPNQPAHKLFLPVLLGFRFLKQSHGQRCEVGYKDGEHDSNDCERQAEKAVREADTLHSVFGRGDEEADGRGLGGAISMQAQPDRHDAAAAKWNRRADQRGFEDVAPGAAAKMLLDELSGQVLIR